MTSAQTCLTGKGNEWSLLFRWEALLASSTERHFTLDATRAGPYRHAKRYSTFGLGMAEIPAASSMCYLNSAAVVLHIDLG
jgi:predicted ATPase